MEKQPLITPTATRKHLKFKIKIIYDNGANETIYPVLPPNVNPVTPLFMDFTIKNGLIRHVNMTKVRTMDTEITEEREMQIIT